MRIHPFQGETFLNEEFIGGIPVEHDLGEQAVDGHDGDLAGNLHAVFHDFHILAGPDLARLVRELRVVLQAALRVAQVFLKALLRILRGGDVHLAIRIHAPGAGGDFLGESGFDELAVQPDPGKALRGFQNKRRQLRRDRNAGVPELGLNLFRLLGQLRINDGQPLFDLRLGRFEALHGQRAELRRPRFLVLKGFPLEKGVPAGGNVGGHPFVVIETLFQDAVQIVGERTAQPARIAPGEQIAGRGRKGVGELFGKRIGRLAEFAGQRVQIQKIFVREERTPDATIFLNGLTDAGEKPVKGRRGARHDISGPVLLALGGAAQDFLKERRVEASYLLGAAMVVGADVIQIGAVGEGILGDDVHVSAVKFWVAGLAIRRGEALGKHHVSRTKASRIGAAVQNRIAGHFWIDWLAVLAFERRAEHVVPKPVAKQVVALFVVGPMRHVRLKRHQGEDSQGKGEGCTVFPEHQAGEEEQGQAEQQKVGQHRHGELPGRKGFQQGADEGGHAAEGDFFTHDDHQSQSEREQHHGARDDAED